MMDQEFWALVYIRRRWLLGCMFICTRQTKCPCPITQLPPEKRSSPTVLLSKLERWAGPLEPSPPAPWLTRHLSLLASVLAVSWTGSNLSSLADPSLSSGCSPISLPFLRTLAAPHVPEKHNWLSATLCTCCSSSAVRML